MNTVPLEKSLKYGMAICKITRPSGGNNSCGYFVPIALNKQLQYTTRLSDLQAHTNFAKTYDI